MASYISQGLGFAVSSLSANVMLVSACAVTATVLLRVLFRRRREGRKTGPSKLRMRSTSIGSTKMMVSGVLPSTAPYDSIINLALWFDALPRTRKLQDVFRDYIVPHARFHCLPIQEQDCGEVEWVCQRVEIDKHFFVRRAAVRPNLETEGFPNTPEGAVRREAEELLNTLLRTKRDGRPWWEVHIIEAPAAAPAPRGSNTASVSAQRFEDVCDNGDDDGDRPAGMVLVRIHHALGDGVSLMEMFADAVVDDTGSPIARLNLFSPASRGSRASFNPGKTLRYGVSAVKSFFQILSLATVGGDTPCSFQNSSRLLPYQPNRFTVYFPTHSLALIKHIKDSLSSGGGRDSSGDSKCRITVNDVEFALFSGAVRRFLQRHGEDPSRISLRALTPFALTEHLCPETKYQSMLRNFWTFVTNEMPLQEGAAVTRVMKSHESWERLKSTALIPVSFLVHRLNAKLPAAMQKQTSNELMTRISVVFSNVPGPQTQLFLAGAAVGAVHMLYPNVSQQVGILSLNGQVHMAMVMSTFHEKGQTRRWLAECFLEELVEVAAAVGFSRMETMKHIRMV